MLRKVALRNSCGEPAGAALLFYPVEEMDKLPHGETGEGAEIERSQADMEDRLDAAHHQWLTSRMPFGLLWITVDQAQSLRKTHGRDACEAMLRTIEQTLLRQMKPAKCIGRWGYNEFLVLVHERTPELLVEHARRLAGLARTADFRWWGDRVGLTVSIGASQATEEDTLQSLLQPGPPGDAGQRICRRQSCNRIQERLMLPIIGIVVVFAAVITGFLMEKGHLLVLFQPSEIGNHRRRGHGNGAGRKSHAHHQGHAGRCDGRIWFVEVQQVEIPGYAKDAV